MLMSGLKTVWSSLVVKTAHAFTFISQGWMKAGLFAGSYSTLDTVVLLIQRAMACEGVQPVFI